MGGHTAFESFLRPAEVVRVVDASFKVSTESASSLLFV